VQTLDTHLSADAQEAISKVIYDQYKPESMDDDVPRTLEAAVFAIADKADTIAGMFSLGLQPTGSKDPFALRRAANGIVKTIAEHKIPYSLKQLFSDACIAYDGSEAEKKVSVKAEGYNEAVANFLRERLEFYLRDVRGFAYDVVNAVLAANADDVVDALARAEAVAQVRPSEDFESISVAFKRMKNILRQAAEKGIKPADTVDANALTDTEEKYLAKEAPAIAESVKQHRANKNYAAALGEISRLRKPVDAFFDKVMVMVEDERVRANRLSLLQLLLSEFSGIADFSEIVTERK
jgi:glycyl-tRNA synthetase beta chain